MAAISKGCLPKFRESILSTFDTDRPNQYASSYIFIVLKIQRYLIDADFKCETGLDPGEQTYCHDITISDLTCKIKCLLSPKENLQIQQNLICAGSLIQIDPGHCKLHCDDTNLDSESLIILDQVQAVGSYKQDNNTEVFPDPDFSSFSGDREKEDRPLVTGRGTYLSLWNNEDTTGSSWKRLDPQEPGTRADSRITVADLTSRWKRLVRPYPALVVRVVNKSRLRMFGKPYKKDKWPYQLYLEIADHTGSCSVTVWGALCPELLHSVGEGSVLILTSYTVRERFQLMSRPTSRLTTLTQYSIEVGLNKRNPAAEVTVVYPDHVKPEWQLPQLRAEFFTRKQLSSLPDQFNCDVVGVVLNVGACKRIRKGRDGQDFWQYRWLLLVDESSNQPIPIELFATSQPRTQAEIAPGTLLVVTQVRLVHDLGNVSKSRDKRLLYLTTTNESQVHITADPEPGPYSEHPRVQDVSQWRRTDQCLHLLRDRASVGGYCQCPHLPDTLEGYRATFTADRPLELTSGSTLRSRLESLGHREVCQVNVQCHLLHVQYTPRSRSQQTEPRLVPPQKRKSPSKRGVAAPDVVSPIVHKLRSGRAVQAAERSSQPPGGVQVSDSHVATTSGSNSAAPRRGPDVTVDDSYPQILNTAQVCGTRQPSACLLPRAYQAQGGRGLIQKHLHMPSETFKGTKNVLDLEDISPRPPQDYLTLTLAGLNHQVALHAHLLLPPVLSPDVSLIGLLSGTHTTAPFTGGATQLQPDNDREMKVDNILCSACDLNGIRLLSVLDICSLGRENEIVINRIYPITR